MRSRAPTRLCTVYTSSPRVVDCWSLHGPHSCRATMRRVWEVAVRVTATAMGTVMLNNVPQVQRGHDGDGPESGLLMNHAHQVQRGRDGDGDSPSARMNRVHQVQRGRDVDGDDEPCASA